MQRVTGIGGVFFKARDPTALGAWYKAHLGIDVQPWGGAVFDANGTGTSPGDGSTAWRLFPANAEKLSPGSASFMINYRVADLHGLLAALRSEGVSVDDKVEDTEFGKFGWVVDPEGNKIELWQPAAGS